MTEISVMEAKAQFSDILKRVESGESFVITKHGKPVAMLSSTDEDKKSKTRDTMGKLRKLLQEHPIGTFDELQQWKAEGRK